MTDGEPRTVQHGRRSFGAKGPQGAPDRSSVDVEIRREYDGVCTRCYRVTRGDSSNGAFHEQDLGQIAEPMT